ncbi:MAG TPA: hypothetical protein VFR10_05225 [bacterium]|nr:hypothetical protein [bacterium]
MFLRSFLLSSALFMAPSLTWSAVIHVYPDGSGDAPTIDAAYFMANPGDVVMLGPGTFFEHNIPNIAGVELRSEMDDPNTTCIDAGQLGRCLLRAIGTISTSTTIRGITFQNGKSSSEGGLVIANGGRFEKCVFRNGSAPQGGAAVHSEFAVGFSECLFESNSATVGGGAIWSSPDGFEGTEVFQCVFRSNSTSGHGGAIYADVLGPMSSPFQVRESRFEENSAGGDGGGFYSTGVALQNDSCIILLSHFLGNSAANGGGARLQYQDVVISTNFFDNEATKNGGALLLHRIQGSNYNYYDVFARNRAGMKGGAIFIDEWISSYLDNSTFVSNEAPEGGHFYGDHTGTLHLNDSILAFAASGGAAGGSGSVAAGCSDVYGNVGGDFVGPLSDGFLLFSEDPLFCDAKNGDFTLQAESPCLSRPGCGGGYIGAHGQGCGVVSVDSKSWGAIKAMYR